MDKKKQPAKREFVGAGAGNSGSKTLEEALRESEERYRQIFEQDLAVKLLIEPGTGKILKANRAAALFYGYPIETLQQMRISDINQLDPAEIATEMQAALLEKRSYFVFPHRLASGEVRQVEVYSSPIDLSGQRVLYSIIHDISERKKTEKELFLKTILLEAQSEASPDGILVVDSMGHTILANKHFGQMWNIPQEILDTEDDKKMLEFIVVQLKDPDGFGRKVAYLYEHKDEKSYDDVYLIDGRIFERYSSPLVSAGGEYYGRIWFFRDISVRRLTEEKLIKFSQAVESAYDGTVLTDIDGNITYANIAATKTFGYSLEEILKLNVSQVTANPEVATQIVGELINKSGWSGEVLCIRKNKELFTVLLSNSLIKDNKGNTIGLLGVFRDITERKRAEEVIINNMLFQQVLINAVPSPIFYKDTECRYIGSNKAFERYLGLSAEQLIGKTVYDISPMDLAEKYNKADRELLNNPGVQTYEASVVDADGTRLDVVFNKATFTNAEGNIAGLIGVILDITDRKRAEDSLRNSERRLHTLVQTIPDLIWLKDQDGVYLSCNTMFERFFGAKEADIAGKTDYDFVDRELADRFREHDNKAMVAGKTTSNEEWITFADDGHRAYLDTIKTPMHDAHGALIGVLGIGRDITDRQSVERIRKALAGTVQAIAVTVESRDPYTAGHQRRVADLARAIATEMNLPIDMIDGIRMAAAIHDLGKISVPAEILSKPTKLKKTEFDLIKEHSQSGYDILKDIDFPWPVARIVLEHHERMNGSGYPNGLTGDNILMESRILSVADVVESMASHRPYRPSLGIEAALEEIEKNSGTHYDNTVADACVKLFKTGKFEFKSV